MISFRVGDLKAVADPPDGYGMCIVRLSEPGKPGQVIGTINPHLERPRLWVALRPDVAGSDGEGTHESTATQAVEWLLREFIRESGQEP